MTSFTTLPKGLNRAGLALFAVVVPASALALGSLVVSALIPVALLAALSCALLWWRAPDRVSRPSRWVVIAFVVLLLATALQALPLPAGLVAVLSPANADIWARALTPFHEAGPGFHPVSIAPPATHVEMLRGLLYGCVFLAALRITLVEGGRSFLERLLILSTGIVAVSTLLHAELDAERVFGLYVPRESFGYIPGRRGPLLNPNHLAAYLNIGACIAIGAAIDGRSMPRPLSTAAAVLLVGSSLWAGSRGAIGSLGGGVLMLLGLAALRRRPSGSLRVEGLLILGVLLLAGAFIAIGESEATQNELATDDLSKLTIARAGLDLIRLAPVTGLGRGAFETAFPLVTQSPTYMTNTHPENIVVQWLTEWGVPAALAGAATLWLALRPSVLLHAVRPPTGAWVALVVTVVHDFVDFHLEVPGVTVAAAVCTAMVVGARSVSAKDGVRGRPAPVRRVALASSAAVVVAVLLVWSNRAHSLSEDRQALAKSAVDRTVPTDDFRADVRAAMLRFPAEPYFPLAGAIRAQAMGEGAVVPWVGHALERAPRFGRAHLILARELARRNRSQARLEYRLAYSEDSDLREAITKEALGLVNGFDAAMELVPEGAEGAPMLEVLADAVGKRLPATSVRLDAELLRRAPDAVGPLRRDALRAVSELTEGELCDQTCLDRSSEVVSRLVERDPQRCDPRVWLARVRIALGEREAALSELERWTENADERPKCLRAITMLAIEQKQPVRVERALSQVVKSGCGTSEECLDLYVWAGAASEAAGTPARAATFYRRASELAPHREDLIERRARAAARAGLNAEALAIYQTLAARHPDDARWRDEMDRLSAMVRALATAPPR